MNVVIVVASVLIGVVFVVAGASKLAAGEQWHADARDLGAPLPVARVLPWVELVTGAALIARLAVPIPAIVAVAMLVAFSVLIVLRLRDDERPSCACFGAWSASEIGRGHLIRNGVLLAIAVIATLP
jgi:uncharacterized membrane protein YphA (DoxX/SURF4 family)